MADAGLFLVSDWVNLSGMNNCLMYGVGCWGANSAGGANASPYNASIAYSTTDGLSGTAVTNAPASSFQDNGELVTASNNPPTLGYIYVPFGNADGASAQRVFQVGGVTENTQTWKSYIAHNAMWVGDTPEKRLFFRNSGGAVAQALDLASMGNLSTSPTPSNSVAIVGTNFASTYTEGIAASPTPTPTPTPFGPV
jgi:hypothetical protein